MPIPGQEFGLLTPVQKPDTLGSKVRGEIDIYETNPTELIMQAQDLILRPDAYQGVRFWVGPVLKELKSDVDSTNGEVIRKYKVYIPEGKSSAIPFDMTKNFYADNANINKITDDQHFVDLHPTVSAGASIPSLSPGDIVHVVFKDQENFRGGTITEAPRAKGGNLVLGTLAGSQRFSMALSSGALSQSGFLKIQKVQKYFTPPNALRGQLVYAAANQTVANAALDFESFNFESLRSSERGYFKTFVDNDAGAGASFGFIQFNQRVGGLANLFKEMNRLNPTLFKKHFGKYAEKLINTNWVRKISFRTGELISSKLKGLIIQTASIKIFRDAQYNVAKREYFDKAVGLCSEYGLKSINAYAMATGVGIQFGFSARSGLRFFMEQAKKQVGEGYSEEVFLTSLATLVDKKRWQVLRKVSKGTARAMYSLKYFGDFFAKPSHTHVKEYRFKGATLQDPGTLAKLKARFQGQKLTKRYGSN